MALRERLKNMDIFLLVSPPKELKSWGNILGETIEKNGGEVVVFDAVDQATNYLDDPNISLENVREVITSPFGGVNGPWRKVQEAAQKRNITTALVTSVSNLVQEEDLENLAKEGVNVIDRTSFDIREYAIERFFQGGSRQEKR